MASYRSSFRLFAALSITLAATTGFGQYPTIRRLDATSGTATISSSFTTSFLLQLENEFRVDLWAVAGGGSGGTPGAVSSNQDNWGTGGGGGGGVRSINFPLSATSYAVTVGGGGAAPAYVSGSTSRGNNGADSVFGTYTATGGGGGGGGRNAFNGVGGNGGSGGGGGGKYIAAGGSGVTGFSGGDARAGDGSTAGGRTAGGGGGGQGTPGLDAVSTVAGNGGAGINSSITGSTVTYGGGGGGGAGDIYTTPTAGLGGSGGGGNGGANTAAAGNGTDGLGGGGGGRGADGVGGQGGSGVVIVRYQGASLGSVGGTVTTGSGSAAGYTIHTFTTSGTTTGTSAFNLSGVDMNARLGVTLTGTISGSGSLTFAGPGRLTLAANNTFTGDTRVTSGTLVPTFGALQYSTLDMNSSDSGAVAFSQNALLGGLKGSRNLDNGGRYLFVGGNNSSTTFSGNLSGGGGLSKEGTGTLTLSGSNSFTGDTTIEGVMLLNSDHALAQGLNLFVYTSGTLDRAGRSVTLARCDMFGTVLNTGGGGVLSANTLTGAGLIDGDVVVAVTQDPGDIDAGIQTFTGNLTESPGSLVRWQLFDNSVGLPGVNYDQIVLSSTANLAFSGSNVLSLLFNGSEGSKVEWSNSFWDVNRAWTVFDLASGVTTGFGNLSLGGSLLDSVGNTLLPTRGAFSLSQVGQDVVLQYNAVPEPATSATALAGLACGGYLVRQRRKRA